MGKWVKKEMVGTTERGSCDRSKETNRTLSPVVVDEGHLKSNFLFAFVLNTVIKYLKHKRNTFYAKSN